MKLLTIVGARPQFVKAAALSRELLSRKNIEEIIVHTGQHFDQNMSNVFFDEMNIPKPKYNLEINSLGHGAMTGRMLEGIEQLILDEKPQMVLVYGDTNSTIAGALAAKKLHVSVGHVEAGLRSFNMRMPEEVNRILTDRISDHLFCPTDTAIKNLKNEGYDNIACAIHRSGDVMQDAAMFYSQTSAAHSNIIARLGNISNFVLVTIHRAENTDDSARLREIVRALNEINRTHQIICPLHPRTRKIMASLDIQPEFQVIDPVGYFDMVELLKAANLVMTDSGGVQKEAFFFKNPCITLRDQTEWTELVDGGFNKVVGTNHDQIIAAREEMLGRKLDFNVDLYGGGKASANIADVIEQIN